MTSCQCIYNEAAHPWCEREDATTLIDLQPGSGNQVAAMCAPCARQWQFNHPYMEMVTVAEDGAS